MVGAIIPWNGPLGLISYKIAPALIAGCTVVLKSSPEAPGEGYLVAEVAEEIGLPPGVLNVVTADREVSELLVRDPRVDKITFTGSTAAGRRIASLCGERIARCTLELGGKSAAVVLDDADLEMTARRLAQAECMLTGQVCSSLTRIVVHQHRHDELVEALVGAFSQVRVGNQFDPDRRWGPWPPAGSATGCWATSRRAWPRGRPWPPAADGPKHLDKGWFVEPTVFGNVENSQTIAREEIFGPVLSVIPAEDEQDAVAIANDTIYGLNARCSPTMSDRAREVAGQLRSGTVGHNSFRTDFAIAFGGSSSRASVARGEPRDCCRSSRPRRSSWRSLRRSTARRREHDRAGRSPPSRGTAAIAPGIELEVRLDGPEVRTDAVRLVEPNSTLTSARWWDSSTRSRPKTDPVPTRDGSWRFPEANRRDGDSGLGPR